MKRKFDRINIEIINTCNLKCSFCPAPERQAKAMTPTQFTEIVQKIASLTHEVVLHLLGEPLSHPDLDLIIQAAEKENLPVHIVTNGVLLHGTRVNSLLRPIVRQVSISLQSFANNFPNQDPEVYLTRLKKFVERAAVEREDLYINLRFWDLEGTLATETSKNQNMRDSVARIFAFDWQKILVDVRRHKGYRLAGRLYLHFDSHFTWPHLNNEVIQEQGYCHALRGHFGIHSDGTVVPCCLDHNADIPLGNIFKEPIRDILTSHRAQNMLQGFAKRELREDLCKRCGYISRFR